MKELFCKNCSEKLDEIEYYGQIVYECPNCGQLHDEYGDIINEEELENKFITDENEKDELLQDRKESGEEKSFELLNEEMINELDNLTIEEIFYLYTNHADQEVREEIELRFGQSILYNDDIKSIINYLHNVYDHDTCDLITDILLSYIDEIDDDKSLSEPLLEYMKGDNPVSSRASIIIISYLDNKNILKKFIKNFSNVKIDKSLDFDVIFDNIKDKVSKNELSKLIINALKNNTYILSYHTECTIDYLKKIKDKKALKEIINIRINDKNSIYREEAIDLLKYIVDKEEIKSYINVLLKDNAKSVREKAFNYLNDKRRHLI